MYAGLWMFWDLCKCVKEKLSNITKKYVKYEKNKSLKLTLHLLLGKE